MAISRAKKEKILKNIIEKLKKAKLFILLDYSGATVSEIQNLKKRLKEKNVEYFVARKTLIQKALREVKINDLNLRELKKPVSLVLTDKKDPAAAKVIKDFQRETRKTEFLKGFLEGEVLEKNDLVMLASISSREELLAKLIGSIASPVSGFIYVLKSNLTGLVSVLRQASEKK